MADGAASGSAGSADPAGVAGEAEDTAKDLEDLSGVKDSLSQAIGGLSAEELSDFISGLLALSDAENKIAAALRRLTKQ